MLCGVGLFLELNAKSSSLSKSPETTPSWATSQDYCSTCSLSEVSSRLESGGSLQEGGAPTSKPNVTAPSQAAGACTTSDLTLNFNLEKQTEEQRGQPWHPGNPGRPQLFIEAHNPAGSG